MISSSRNARLGRLLCGTVLAGLLGGCRANQEHVTPHHHSELFISSALDNGRVTVSRKPYVGTVVTLDPLDDRVQSQVGLQVEFKVSSQPDDVTTFVLSLVDASSQSQKFDLKAGHNYLMTYTYDGTSQWNAAIKDQDPPAATNFGPVQSSGTYDPSSTAKPTGTVLPASPIGNKKTVLIETEFRGVTLRCSMTDA